MVAVEAAVAHLVCSVLAKQEVGTGWAPAETCQIEGDDEHWLVTAKITEAYAKSSYW